MQKEKISLLAPLRSGSKTPIALDSCIWSALRNKSAVGLNWFTAQKLEAKFFESCLL